MSSPDYFRITRYLRIDRKSKEAIYLQLVSQFVNAVQRGYLSIGMKLPGTRIMSEQLGVHRKTLIATMQELSAQGWVETVPNVGTFVQNPQVKRKFTDHHEFVSDGFPINTAFYFKQSQLLDNPFEPVSQTISLDDSLIDYRIINHEEILRLYKSSFQRKRIAGQMKTNIKIPNEFFLEQLCFHVNLTRGMHLSPKNITSFSTRESCLSLLANWLISPNQLVLVANLGFQHANLIFQQAGAILNTIPVDQAGLNVGFIRNNFKPNQIRCLYLNSHAHYPTTVSLSEKRRSELVQLAVEYNFFIIEDDVDFEVHFEKTYLPPVVSYDKTGRIIYLGAFGNFLSPTFQRCFMIAPEDFQKEFNKHAMLFESKHDLIVEQMLGELIDSGDYARLMKRIVKTIRERRNYFVGCLIESFEDEVVVNLPIGGNAVWINWNKHFSLKKLKAKAEEFDLHIPQSALFQNAGLAACRLGFGHLTHKEIDKTMMGLRMAYDAIL